jgi:hypothetical protein
MIVFRELIMPPTGRYHQDQPHGLMSVGRQHLYRDVELVRFAVNPVQGARCPVPIDHTIAS